jgi:release factor glutamine methyltransferase
MKVKDLIRTNNKDIEELLLYILKTNNIESKISHTLTIKEKIQFEKSRERLLKNTPIEYIIKKAYFYKSEFIVNKNVLIPRVETESIIPYLLNYKKILDIGTGSGAIGISVKKENPSISVTLSDISKKALDIAQKNIGNLDIQIIQSNLIDKININNIDCIFANLPYIKEGTHLPQSVIKYEPKIALFGGKDGLFYIKELIKDLYKKKWEGDLFLEMDPDQINKIKLKKKIIKDPFDYNRFVMISYPITKFNINTDFN